MGTSHPVIAPGTRAYSYLRFSSPKQSQGDSVRRQTELTLAWCEKHKTVLDTSLRIDRAVSGFKGANRDDLNGLGQFLKMIENKKVPPGSCLVIENLDRLSREKVTSALHLFTGILMAGVKIVQLMPVEIVFSSHSEMPQLMMAVMELSRGHAESVLKSERVGAAWGRKRREAGTRQVTSIVPGWISIVDGERVLNKHAATVRKIFELALSGLGVAAIARRLNEDKAPLMGKKRIITGGVSRPISWGETVVHAILTKRRVLGEYQPCRADGAKRIPDGPAVQGYYPAVVDEKTWHAAQYGLKSRTTHSGRRSKHPNIFAGLLFDARDGTKLGYKHATRCPAIVPTVSKRGSSPWTSFPIRPFETGLLLILLALDFPEIERQSRTGTEDAVELASLTHRITELDTAITTWKGRMSDPSMADIITATLPGLVEQKAKLLKEFGLIKGQQAGLPFTMFRDFHEVMTGEDRFKVDADGYMNLNLRGTPEVVRGMVRDFLRGIHCRFLRWKTHRVALVKIEFKTKVVKEWLIWHGKKGTDLRATDSKNTIVTEFDVSEWEREHGNLPGSKDLPDDVAGEVCPIFVGKEESTAEELKRRHLSMNVLPFRPGEPEFPMIPMIRFREPT